MSGSTTHAGSAGGNVSRAVRVAVAGNPNSGKSTLVNALAGTRLRIGNWPGVTLDKGTARLERDGCVLDLVDLPGIYSLSPFTYEETIARDHLVRNRPDVILNVVDATNLERNLYLTVQLLELGIPVVVALNIHDEAVARGDRIDVALLAERLGIPVVATSATKRTGLDLVLDAVTTARRRAAPSPLSYGREADAALAELTAAIQKEYAIVAPALPVSWLGLKILERDGKVLSALADPRVRPGMAAQALEATHAGDIEGALAEARHRAASDAIRGVVARQGARKSDATGLVDRLALHPIAGMPVFLLVMWFVFKLTFDVSAPFGDWIRSTMDGPIKRWVAAILLGAHAPAWTVSLIDDGVIAGVGFVLVFVPVIFMMMFFITLLEGSGYMARAAFVMDRAMSCVGLQGKSFIPMLLGFGCNVPAVYATRALESPRERLVTALLVPMMSCGARLPVYVLFAGVFFPQRSGTVVWSLYVIGVAVALTAGIVMGRIIVPGQAAPFLLEMPPYRVPSIRTVAVHSWEKGKHFLFKAGSYVLAVSVFVWFLLNLPWGVQDKRDSWLGIAGEIVAPVFAPVGFGTWDAASALITGVIAKEIVVGTMSVIHAPDAPPRLAITDVREDLTQIATSFAGAARRSMQNVASTVGIRHRSIEEPDQRPELAAAIGRTFTPLSAYAFMIFVLLYMPCVVVGVALRQEFGTWKWFALASLYQTALAWSAAFMVYQGGRLLGLGG